ncbi:MAG: winged helix-turn-helix domain-containing protein [Clostridia bacterium]|nr:winged helix-turn-helix domain-containing protein [Clostridia bacterium]
MILVIDKSRDAAQNLSDMLHYLGILSLGTTPKEALGEIRHTYRAIILSSPSTLPDGRDYLTRLRRYATGIPVFAVGECEDALSPLVDLYCPLGCGATGIVNKIQAYCEERALPVPGRYTLAGIDVSRERRAPEYLGTPLPFTKTECMILRALISSYPVPISSERILELSYRQHRRPEVSNVRTHISVMNKKFATIFGRSLIRPTFGEGYSILTPEVMEQAKNPVYK